MNTKYTPPYQSRQTSMTPHTHSTQRNGCLPSNLCTPGTNKPSILRKTDSVGTFEMQNVTHQYQTLEAFEELEQLVPNGGSNRASLVRMSSIIQEQDNLPTIDKSQHKGTNSNHS